MNDTYDCTSCGEPYKSGEEFCPHCHAETCRGHRASTSYGWIRDAEDDDDQEAEIKITLEDLLDKLEDTGDDGTGVG